MHKKIFSVLATVFMAFSFSVSATVFTAFSFPISAYAESDSTGYDYSKIVIDDSADLLSADEENLLKEAMAPITQYGYVAFASTNDDPYYSTSTYAEKYYHSLFGTDSGTLFVIDMDERNIWIFSDGYIYTKITTSKANTITDNVYDLASDEEYYKCAKKAYSQIYTVLNGQKIAEPMKYICNALFAIALALVINGVVIFGVSRAHKVSDSELVKGTKLGYKLSGTKAAFTHTTKRYNPHTSSSGGGGGGGGGGGSSGGGGGHSF